jgi:hypothetical protein
MDFNATQYVRMTLAGTVPLPPTLPEPGTIELANAPDVDSQIVCITQRDTSVRNIRRFVRLEDICAVATTGEDGQVDWTDLKSMLTGDALVSSLRNGKSHLLGVAFVKEQAQVLVQVEMSMAACESAAAPRAGFMHPTLIPSHNPCCIP